MKQSQRMRILACVMMQCAFLSCQLVHSFGFTTSNIRNIPNHHTAVLISNPISTHLKSLQVQFYNRQTTIRRAETDETKSNDNNEEPPATRPDLVSQSSFASAVETIEREVSKANGVEYNKDPNTSYMLGRLKVNLQLPPGIDLIETPTLVLINGIDQRAVDCGVKPLDTVVGIASTDGNFQKSTMEMDIEAMVGVIKEGMLYARNNGQEELEFELNRLIKGYRGEANE